MNFFEKMILRNRENHSTNTCRTLRNIIIALYLVTPFTAFSQVDLDWVFHAGTNFNLKDVEIDQNGNVYITGSFAGTIDFDPGPATHNLVSVDPDTDIFLAKYDSSGNYVWAESMGGNNTEIAFSLSIGADNYIYMAGEESSTNLDMDPGPAVFHIGTSGVQDAFIAKYDLNGNFIFAYHMGGTGSASIIEMQLDDSSNMYVAGVIDYPTDFDPSTGIHIVGSESLGDSDFFIAKYDQFGALVFVNVFVAAGAAGVYDIKLDSVYNIYVSGYFSSITDFDPGPDTANLNALGGNGFIAKYDRNGNYLMAFRSGNPYGYLQSDFTFDDQGNIYTVGYFAGGSIDFDPGPGSYPVSGYGLEDAFFAKYNPFGNLKYVKTLGGSGYDKVSSIGLNPFGQILIGGDYDNTVDFDPGPGIANLSGDAGFLAKYDTAGNYVYALKANAFLVGDIMIRDSGELYLWGFHSALADFSFGSGATSPSTANGAYVARYYENQCAFFGLTIDSVSNTSCLDSGYTAAVLFGGVEPYTISWNTVPSTSSANAFFAYPGIYTITATDTAGCTTNRSVLVNGPDSSHYGFYDLNANLLASSFIPGYYSQIWVDAFNDGCDTISGYLTLTIDDSVTVISSAPVPDSISGNIFIWNFTSLSYDGGHISPHLILNVSAACTTGDSLSFEVVTKPVVGDIDTVNNHKTYRFPIVDSYDPNIKGVYPQGECEEHYVQQGQKMTYSVLFQNTGTADAINIYVLDTLDADLDLNTVRIVGNSHPLITEVLPGNVLKFRFDNIHLADSTSDEAHSHGYVIYQMDQQPSLASGTILENTAYIYFDFNPAVVTNTVSNTVVPVIPPCGFVTQAMEQQKEKGMKVYPNPTTGNLTISTGNTVPEKISIVDLSGRTVMNTKPVAAVTNLDVSGLQSGVYFVKVKVAGGEETVKLVKE